MSNWHCLTCNGYWSCTHNTKCTCNCPKCGMSGHNRSIKWEKENAMFNAESYRKYIEESLKENVGK